MKKRRVTSIAAATLMTVILAGANLKNNIVKADVRSNNNTDTTAKAQTAEEAAQANVDSAQNQVNAAQGQVNSAKNALDNAKAQAAAPDKAYDDQAAKTDDATKDENAKNDSLNKANDAQKAAQDLADEAKKPGAIDDAKNKVDVAQKDVNAKNKAVTDAQAKTGDAQKAVDDAKKDVNTKQADLTAKQQAKTDADTQVKNAEDALKGTGVDEAKTALDNSNKKVADDQSALTKAKQDEANAKNVLGTGDVTDLLNNAQTAVTDAKSSLTKANQAVIDKQTEIINLNVQKYSINEYNKNTIVIPDLDKYKEAYKTYVNTKNLYKYIDYFNEARDANQFIPSEMDQHNMVYVNNLTDVQLEELSLFTVDLLSKLRQQLGWSADQVTAGSMQMAKDIAANYLNDGWNINWHDVDAIKAAAAKNGLNSSDNYYEDKGNSSEDIPVISMDELKHRTYDTILNMIFPDGNGITSPDQITSTYEMGHAADLLGAKQDNPILTNEITSSDKDSLIDIRNEIVNNVDDSFEETVGNNVYEYNINGNNECIINDKSYTLDAFLNFLNKQIEGIRENGEFISAIPTNIPNSNFPFSIHFIGIDYANYIVNKSKFDTTIIPSYADQIKELDQKLQVANSDLNTLMTTANEKQTKVDETKKALKKITDAKTELDVAQNRVQKYTDLLDAAKSDSDVTKQAQAQSRYDTLTASNEEKAKNLTDAQAAQTKAQNDVNAAQTALNAAKSALTKAQQAQTALNNDIAQKQTAATDAQKALTKAQDHVKALENAPQNLETAKQAVVDAQKAYEQAKDVATKATQALDALKPAKQAADSQVAQAQAAYNTALSQLAQAQTNLTNAQNTLDAIQHPAINVVDTTNTTTTTNTQSATPIATTKTFVLTHNAYVYNAKAQVVKQKGKKVLLKKGRTVKALNKGKVVTIKGIKFYQIGKNKYVKVANTKKQTITAKIKAAKNHKVKVYLSNGKFAKKYVLGQKSYKFDEKKVIKGKTYYRITGKNLWVLASDLTLKK